MLTMTVPIEYKLFVIQIGTTIIPNLYLLKKRFSYHGFLLYENMKLY